MDQRNPTELNTEEEHSIFPKDSERQCGTMVRETTNTETMEGNGRTQSNDESTTGFINDGMSTPDILSDSFSSRRSKHNGKKKLERTT